MQFNDIFQVKSKMITKVKQYAKAITQAKRKGKNLKQKGEASKQNKRQRKEEKKINKSEMPNKN